VSVEEHSKGEVKCRDDKTGAFVSCGIGSVGEFVTKKSRSKGGHGKMLTPHPRWGTGQQFWNVTPAGAAHLRQLYKGKARLVSPFSGKSASSYQYALRKIAGIGNFGMQDVKTAFKFHPQTVEPGKVIIGNVVGSFLPAIVDKVMERTTTTERTKGFVRFSVGAAGLAGVLFGRKNSYVLGASLALLPAFVDSVSTWVVSFIMKARGGTTLTAGPASIEIPEVTMEGIGQMTDMEKRRLNAASFKAFGRGIQGAGRIGMSRGQEVSVPQDSLDIANASRMVAGIGSPIGGNGFRALGA
jgi:hypothetical protein